MLFSLARWHCSQRWGILLDFSRPTDFFWLQNIKALLSIKCNILCQPQLINVVNEGRSPSKYICIQGPLVWVVRTLSASHTRFYVTPRLGRLSAVLCIDRVLQLLHRIVVLSQSIGVTHVTAKEGNTLRTKKNLTYVMHWFDGSLFNTDYTQVYCVIVMVLCSMREDYCWAFRKSFFFLFYIITVCI